MASSANFCVVLVPTKTQHVEKLRFTTTPNVHVEETQKRFSRKRQQKIIKLLLLLFGRFYSLFWQRLEEPPTCVSSSFFSVLLSGSYSTVLFFFWVRNNVHRQTHKCLHTHTSNARSYVF